MANQSPLRDLKIKYRKSDDYRLVPVSGAYGGPNPKGENVIIHFFFEHGEVPEEVTLQPVEGRANEYTEAPMTSQEVVRDVFVGISMTAEQAVSIGRWIANHGQHIVDIRRRPDA